MSVWFTASREKLKSDEFTMRKILPFLFMILLMADLCRSVPELIERKRREVSVTFLDLFVKSEGCSDVHKTAGTCGIAYIKVQGVERSLQSRGHNIVVVEGATGAFIESQTFDTYTESAAGDQMRDYLNNITGDKIVLIAIQDSASNHSLSAADAFKRLGATDPIFTEYRNSFAFIGYAGENKPLWIAQEQAKAAEGPSTIKLRIPLQQGPAGVQMNVSLRSEGCEDPGKTGCGRAFIKVNNIEYSVYQRGFNVAVFSQEGLFMETRGFDTHKFSKAGISAVSYLNELSDERIVLVAVQDEASVHGGAVVDKLIERLGASAPILLQYRSSFALAGYTGASKPSWISQAQALRGLGPSIVTTTIEPIVEGADCADTNL